MGRGNRKRVSRLSQSQPAGCARWSRRDGDAAGGNVVLEECLPFPGAVLYSGGGNGMLPDSAMETGKTVFTDGYHRSSMRMQGIFTYNSGQPLLVTQGGLHRGCGLVFTDNSGQSLLRTKRRGRNEDLRETPAEIRCSPDFIELTLFTPSLYHMVRD